MDAFTGRDVLVLLDRAHHRSRAELDDRVLEFGLSYAQCRVLETIADRTDMHIGEVGRRVGVTRQTAHGLVRRLELQDLVDVFPASEGVRKVVLTAEGRKWFGLFLGAIGEVEARIEKRLDPEQREQLIVLLAAVERAVKPPPPPWWM